MSSRWEWQDGTDWNDDPWLKGYSKTLHIWLLIAKVGAPGLVSVLVKPADFRGRYGNCNYSHEWWQSHLSDAQDFIEHEPDERILARVINPGWR